MDGRISGMRALKCVCAGSEIPAIKAMISDILPNAQIIEELQKRRVREAMRAKGSEVGERELSRLAASRLELRQKHERLAAALVPLAIIPAGLWIGLSAFTNTRDRRSELGMYRAIGFGSGTILALFLVRAALAGVCGGLIGIAVTIISANAIANDLTSALSPGIVISAILAALIGAPLLAALSAWIPSMLAVAADPADILREE